MTLVVSSISHSSVLNTFPASCCNRIKDLPIRIKNFVSKYFLEPLEHLIFQTRSSIGAFYWIIKNLRYRDDSPSPFGSIKLIDEEFKKTSIFQKLQSLDPLLADPKTRAERIDVLNNLLKAGTCFGQSLILLNDPSLLKTEKNPDDMPNEMLGREATYLQTIQMLQISVNVAISIKERMARVSRDPQEFISASGTLDEAKIFDFLHQQKPKVFRFLIRGMTKLISPEMLATPLNELIAKKVQLSTVVDSHFSSDHPVVFQKCFFLAKKGPQNVLDQNIQDFFTKNKGTYVLSSWDNDKKLGHAIFIDNTGKECQVFDPAIGASYKFADATNGICGMLNFMHALFPAAKTMHHRVSTLA